jgi:hypothetical protein
MYLHIIFRVPDKIQMNFEEARGKVMGQGRKKYPSSWYLEKNN